MDASVGQVLSILSGRLLVASFDDIYKILEFLVGGPVFTSQIPRVVEESRDHVKAQCAWATEVLARPEWNYSNEWWHEYWQEFVSSIENQYGTSFPIEPRPTESVKEVDPIEELHQMAPNLKIFVVS